MECPAIYWGVELNKAILVKKHVYSNGFGWEKVYL